MSVMEKKRSWPDWFLLLIIIMFIINLLPFLAPVFMKLGWTDIGQGIYSVYSMACHQMAQRSFFLFGPKGFQMYELSQLPVDITGDSMGTAALELRHFLGNEQYGWKVAWSDRMVYMYVTPLLAAISYAFIREFGWVKPLPLWGFVLLMLPMAIDGTTHLISDTLGMVEGFRYHNTWLAELTGYALPTSFYVGDSFGSFNSWMRLLSGLTFGLGIAWLAYPYIQETIEDLDKAIAARNETVASLPQIDPSDSS